VVQIDLTEAEKEILTSCESQICRINLVLSSRSLQWVRDTDILLRNRYVHSAHGQYGLSTLSTLPYTLYLTRIW